MLSSLKLVIYSGLQCFMCHVRYSRSLIKLDMQFNLTLTGRKHNIVRQHCNCRVVTSELFRTVVVFRDNRLKEPTGETKHDREYYAI